jgi:ketosteroid isomerase-like protein
MRKIAFSAALVAVVAMADVARSRNSSEPNDPQAQQLAEKILEKGAQLYDTKDARAMAETYTDDAEVVVVTKDRGETKTDAKRGRAEIESLYQSLFKDAGTIHAKNTVEYARLIDPEMLLICGVFQPDTDALRVPFVQVRVKKGDRWLISSLRIFVAMNQ